MARPTELPARVTVYLSEDEAQALELVADRDARSKSYVLRRLWLQQMERETTTAQDTGVSHAD